MELIIVSSERDKKDFHRIQRIRMADEPNFRAPLETEIEKIFSPAHNPLFASGNAVRFILKQDAVLIGRAAAFYHGIHAADTLRAGAMGFFDCTDDQQAAGQLFDACKNWLSGQGCNAMDGPVNFGTRDRWWGLLTDGFAPPLYGMSYHLPYYKKLFEAYGFKNYFEQYTFTLHRSRPMPDIVYVIAERLRLRNAIRCVTGDELPEEKMIKDFAGMYNAAWREHDNYTPMKISDAEKLFRDIRPVVDKKLLIFAYAGETPAGFFIGLPDANQLLQYAHGKLNAAGKINILLHRPFIRMKNIYGIIFGVVPGQRNKGIEAAMAATMHERMNKSRYYEQIELLWIGSFNKKMLNFVRQIRAQPYRTLITYRIIFDPAIPFQPCPDID